jgi:protein SCO1
MIRSFLRAALILNLATVCNAQMKAPSPVDIEEKLGQQIAMDVVLKDEMGADVTLRHLIDKPTILIFNYFKCPGICPVLIHNMVDVINKMPIEPGREYQLIAVSFDPTDTPELAREKKASYLNQLRRPFAPDAWHFLTGTAENTHAVADSAGFQYRQQGDMYAHPGAIILLTPMGTISRYLYGTSFVPSDVEMAVKQAAGSQVIPTVSKLLSFCYAYDPAGRTYVLSVTRLAGVATLIIVAIFAVSILWKKAKKKELS